MKVYLVWRYSETLDGVFASRESAEKYIDSELLFMNSELEKRYYRDRSIFYIEETPLRL
jgi:hypothetical protein